MRDICQYDIVIDPVSVRRDLCDGVGIIVSNILFIDLPGAGAVEILRLNDLCLIGIEVIEVFRSGFFCPVLPRHLVYDGDGGLAQNGNGGNDDLILSGVLLE